MRRGFLLAVLGLGALALFALMLIAPRGGTSTAQPGPTDSDGATSVEAQAPKESPLAGRSELRPAQPAAIAQAKADASDEPAVSAQDEQNEARVAARIAELWKLSAKTDHASLETLLSEVRNRDQEIREAALDAISQSGNRAAIPGLREAVAQTADAQEKQAILDVIEFMSLPTLTEILRGQGATNDLRPQARP